MRLHFKKLLTVFIVSTFSLARGYEAIIFDCDGVLVDTEYLKFQAWHAALEAKGINLTEQEYESLVGHSSEYIAKAIQAQKHEYFDSKEVIANKDNIYHARQKQGVPVLEKGVNFLKKIISKKENLKIKLGLASAAPKAEILENLKQINVEATDFDVIASGKDDLNHIQDKEGVNKPKPYIYQLCAEKLEVVPCECLVFEDTSAGVQAASSAGMHVIAVPNSYTKTQNFSSAEKIIDFATFDQDQFIEDFNSEKYLPQCVLRP